MIGGERGALVTVAVTPQRALGGGRRSRPFTDPSARFAQRRLQLLLTAGQGGFPAGPQRFPPPLASLPPDRSPSLPPSFLFCPSPRPTPARAAAGGGGTPRAHARAAAAFQHFLARRPARGWRGRARGHCHGDSAGGWREGAGVGGVRAWEAERGSESSESLAPVRAWGTLKTRGSGSCKKTVRGMKA